eukprot:CAMPEP_0173412916 /NCGR_PEP_ID=MMETSP1356-20130122/80662_1 /TAXON_ID=77927 ORGANISM="Hemiselmis virescens, Strain PCC157" /NCGR_SAMPLE_ID=MMETSP1356 /ASSEMBLY_ACC=CAM_ASM_000847 /LENGTH=69 /DNA_ID=CAMNT_0014374871 /DNA_START=158 /DNA_END=364 /DNA_ORIENTATION=+
MSKKGKADSKAASIGTEAAQKVLNEAKRTADEVMAAQTTDGKKTKTLKAETCAAVLPMIASGDPSNVLQ